MTGEGTLGLESRLALVTGAGGGIGDTIVRRLLATGATVIALDREGVPVAVGAEPAPCDLADPAAIEGVLAEITARHGRLDVIVHAAGIHRDRVLWKLSAEDWDEVLRVNLTSAFHLLHHAVPLLRDHGGSIVLITSINGERGKLGQSSYTASKAGLIGLGKTAARELGRFDIRVNMVAPGMIRTPMIAELPPEILARAERESVLGRLGTPEDVAEAVLFLAGGASRHITGQVLRVDGGQLIA